MKKPKSLSAAYRQLPLLWKINVPFITTCLGIWMLGTVLFTYIFSNYLESRQQQRLHDVSDLVVQEFEDIVDDLQTTAKLLSNQEAWQTPLADADTQNWQRGLLPFKPVLEADIIQVFNAESRVLLSLRQPVLQDVSLDLGTVGKRLVLSTSSLVSASDALFSTLIATEPIGSDQSGGVLIGYALTNQNLKKIADRAGVELVVFSDGRQIASTFTQRGERFSQKQFSQDIYRLRVTKTPYIVKNVEITGLDNRAMTLLVLQSLAPLRRLQFISWLIAFGFAISGTGLAVTVSYLTARKITRPIQAVTQMAQQVVQTGDFNQRVPVTSRDEVGILAKALNQLIDWMGKYTAALKASQTALNTEIEEHMQAIRELKKTQSQLIQAEKMSSLGAMVAGVAHELNNPIGFIQSNLPFLEEYTTDLIRLIQLFQTKYPTPDAEIQTVMDEIELDYIIKDFPSILEAINIGSTRVQDIVFSLRSFSRLDEAGRKSVNLKDGIESTLVILNHRIKRGVKITTDYADAGMVFCYPAQLNQVFMNILTNALDALEESDTDSPQIIICTERADDQTLIKIRDNGPGIPDEVKAKIFDPFFTTKPVGKGTGLGLSICYQIIQKHSGTLSVEQVLPQGTEFAIALPVS